MPPQSTPPASASIDAAEVERFAGQAAGWRQPTGTTAALHRMNPVRLDFLLDHIAAHTGHSRDADQPLAGLTALDLGCGGGLITEPLARLGATVTGTDPVEDMLTVARQHAHEQALNIRYVRATAEELAAAGERYQIVVCMEVVEHVANVPEFLQAVARLLSDDGLLVLSTLNRTAKSYLLAIIGAERVLRWVPCHTHDWHKFLQPSELKQHLQDAGLQAVTTTGFVYHPLSGEWRTSEQDFAVNYGMVAVPKRD